MSVIKAKVVDQTLTITNAPMISAGDIETDFVIFTFDSTWEGYGKNAIFYRDDNKEDVYEAAIDGQGKAIVPREVVATDGKIWLGVIGVNGSNVLTSEVIWYEIVEGFYSASLGSQSAEASIYSQMLTVAGQMEALYNAIQADQEAFETEIEDRVSTFEDEINEQISQIDTSEYATKTELENITIGTSKIEDNAVTGPKTDFSNGLPVNGPMILTDGVNYGDTLPQSGEEGQIFFLKV
jgi:hypothetical protein